MQTGIYIFVFLPMQIRVWQSSPIAKVEEHGIGVVSQRSTAWAHVWNQPQEDDSTELAQSLRSDLQGAAGAWLGAEALPGIDSE